MILILALAAIADVSSPQGMRNFLLSNETHEELLFQ